MFDRGSGILMPISSIPSRFGIGTFGKEAYNYIDFLCESGQRYWQLLPLGPVSYGDSPYSPFSVFAGNPYYIDLELLIEDGVLLLKDCEALDSGDGYVNYEKQFKLRYNVLYKAYENSKCYKKEVRMFCQNNKWVLDYSMFMALKYRFNQTPWKEWERGIFNRNKNSLEEYSVLLSNQIGFWSFLQYVFYRQYHKLKNYANKNGIRIIGDMPIYVSEDSVEAWAERELFVIDDNDKFSLEAGVPPDDFSETGQLWGNPVYNWGYLKENSYEWWINRLKWSAKLYDAVRVDHFRGFDEFWAVKAGSEDAVNGEWYPAEGREMFELAVSNINGLNIIAEDLGVITDSVIELKNKLNFPGMKVLQFAFDGNPDNPHLPHNYEENSVAYTGTHDNDTLKGWLVRLNDETKSRVLKSMNLSEKLSDNDVVEGLIKKVMCSNANLAVIPMQDYLLLDSRARINTPSTVGGNWMWRARKEEFTPELAKKIKSVTEISGRF